ncbi:MAG: glucose-1-phosphate cytidylyltransferase [Bacteroidia bacterium]|jgi:glucose-1-phosphate cytidylyltransferase|nr:glucose-1-phosphate cytidylyltransferase [Bacteroidia bacterium]
MKTVILAGGLGTRLVEETIIRPKPMVEIGGTPILCHVMSIYSHFGFNNFAVALGYKGQCVKEFFLNYYTVNSDLTVNLATGTTTVHRSQTRPWTVDLADTGTHTMTGGRIKRMAPWVGNQTFMTTYGDGLADVDIGKLVAFHLSHGKLATITLVRPPSRFGSVKTEGERIVEFLEKPQTGEGWINGGFFVLEPEVFDYVAGDETVWEREPLERLALEGELMAFRHDGFFQPMDTVREKQILEELWQSGKAPWKFPV